MNGYTRRGDWIIRPHRMAAAAVRLVCAPYAGGAASAYRLWPDDLPSWVDVCAIQLPGREQRYGEAFVTNMPEVAEAVVAAVMPLADLPLVFFGHSMGAIIAFETVRLLQSRHGIVARRLIISGRRAPHLPSARPDMHGLPQGALLDELRRLNGTHTDVLSDPEMLGIVLPIVRADFKLIETYRMAQAVPLACPVSAIGGDADPDVSPAMLRDWHMTTRDEFEMKIFAGDHFYHNAQKRSVLEFISSKLQQAIDLG